MYAPRVLLDACTHKCILMRIPKKKDLHKAAVFIVSYSMYSHKVHASKGLKTLSP